MIKIDGLAEVERQLTSAQAALQALDGELGTVKFDPTDPASIEYAIASMEAMIDDRVAAYNNPLIIGLASSMKEECRKAILDKAAAARMQEGQERP